MLYLQIMSKEAPRINLDTPGLLVHGIEGKPLEALCKILAQGVKPLNHHEDRDKQNRRYASYFPDHVSLCMVGLDGYEATSTAWIWGTTSKWSNRFKRDSITLVIDPDYVKEHPEQFKAVGKLFSQEYRQYKYGEEIPNRLTFEEVDCNVLADEVWADYIPPYAIIALVVRKEFRQYIPPEFTGEVIELG